MFKALDTLAWIVLAAVIYVVVVYWSDIRWAYENRQTIKAAADAKAAYDTGGISGAVQSLKGSFQ